MKVYTQVDGKLAMFEIESDSIELARAVVQEETGNARVFVLVETAHVPGDSVLGPHRHQQY